MAQLTTESRALAALRQALEEAEADVLAATARCRQYREAIKIVTAIGSDDVETSTSPAPPKPPPIPSTTTKSRRAPDLADVARAALDTPAGTSRRAHVAAALGVGEGYAGQLIKQARQAGHDIPYDRTPRPPTAEHTGDTPIGAEFVLRCGQCGWSTAHNDGADDQLKAHCRAKHDRSPTDLEHRPRAPRAFPSPLTPQRANGA